MSPQTLLGSLLSKLYIICHNLYTNKLCANKLWKQIILTLITTHHYILASGHSLLCYFSLPVIIMYIII